MSTPAHDSLEILRPYVSRLLLLWLAERPAATFLETEGSMVFVDISGFTKMSERLARHGKVGAEEVTEVLGAVFARLLAVAYGDGGGLIKFGGDALLLWFSGDEHALRAARAAHGMRATLRSVGRLETTAGKVTLRMSVGVNSGRFHYFLVGGSHRELLITGPAATETVSMESTATAGEILLGPSTVAELPADVLGAQKGPGWLLRSEPVGLSLAMGEPDVPLAGLDLLSYVPIGLRDAVLAGTEPEHRAATVAFVHFDGTDALIEEQGPETAAAALDELVRDVQQAVDEQGVCFLGSDVDADGGKLILTAGVPRVLGDDDERMLLALRRIIAGERRIPVRIGVNRGPVFSAAVGPTYRRTYTVMGDPVNLAARLMAKAQPGEIYASASVLDGSTTRFDLTELEPFTVKGKARPVEAWSVGKAVGSRRREGGAERHELIGREDELQVLVEALDSARGGQGRLVELVGEPGIGKTRLLEELRAGARDVRVLHATADAYTSSTPYIVWRELLRDLLAIGWEDPDEVVLERLHKVVESVDPQLLPWIPLLGLPLDIVAPSTPEVDLIAPEFRRARLHEVVERFLNGLLDTPTLIQIEDVHLMDAASADLLGAIVNGLVERPWLVVVTRRESDTGFVGGEADHVVTRSIGPLTPEEELALVRAATAAAPLLPHDQQLIAERSAGNPQFLLDLVHAKAAGSMLPDSVEAAAMARIDQLGPDDRAIVRRASVLGVSFHPRFLDDVLDEGVPRPDGATWERLAEFFEDDGDGYVRFRRAIVRDAAYTGLPFRLRRRLHEAAGLRLERELGDDAHEAGGILSLHFLLAGDDPKAWRYAKAAGDRAAGQFANEGAAQLYRRAIEAGRSVRDVDATEIAAVDESLGDVLDLAGDFPKAADAYAAARRLVSDDPLATARLLYKRSRIEESLGRYPQALRWATRGRKALDGLDDPEAAKLMAQLSAWYATILYAAGRASASVRWAERAIAEAKAADDLSALARAYNALELANILLGRPFGTDWPTALKIYEDRNDLVGQVLILSNLGYGSYFEGRWDASVSFYERARILCSRIGDHVGLTLLADNIAEIHCERGQFDEAERMLRGSLAFWQASKHGYFHGLCLRFLGRVVARTGRFDEALATYDQARAAFVHAGALEDIVGTDAGIAECRVLMGQPDEALGVVEEALKRRDGDDGGGLSTAVLERVRGFALTQSGDLAGARTAFDASLRAASSRRDDYEVGLTLHAMGWLDRIEGRAEPVELEAEAWLLLHRLGIESVLEVPLPGLDREHATSGPRGDRSSTTGS